MTGLSNGTTYYFTVVSVNAQGASGYSNEARATPDAVIYSYAAHYDGVGNVSSYTDSVMGAWSFGYDGLNRLTSGTPQAGSPYSGMGALWRYDAFGNRLTENFSGAPVGSVPIPPSSNAAYDAHNRVRWVQSGLLPSYDGAGNVIADDQDQYLYDPEGRVCAVENLLGGGMTGYLYDAEGRRVAKGSIQNMNSCDPAVNGFQLTTAYVLDAAGNQMTEMQANGGGLTWQHTNVWAGGKLLGTCDTQGLHFYFDDPLGTRRAQTNAAGMVEQRCVSLPFGNGESCTPTPTEHLFTSKERDAESGNDYFGARYYSSTTGRFLIPDWSAKADPVPYAKLDDPQSLNLYSYVRNNPLASFDPDGHDLPAPPPGSEYVPLPGAANQVQAAQMARDLGLTNFTILAFNNAGQLVSSSAPSQLSAVAPKSFTPLPVFQNQNEAAMNAAAGIKGAMQTTGWEWSAALYKTEDGMIGVTPLRTDHECCEVGTTDYYTGKDIPSGATRIGDIHGHPGINSSDGGMHMSDGDKAIASTMLKVHGTETMYMVNSKGQVWKYNPATDTQPVIPAQSAALPEAPAATTLPTTPRRPDTVFSTS